MKVSVEVQIYRGFQDLIFAKIAGGSIGPIAHANGTIFDPKYNDFIPAINSFLKRA
jgi:hypothetical protein